MLHCEQNPTKARRYKAKWVSGYVVVTDTYSGEAIGVVSFREAITGNGWCFLARGKTGSSRMLHASPEEALRSLRLMRQQDIVADLQSSQDCKALENLANTTIQPKRVVKKKKYYYYVPKRLTTLARVVS
jgi:hypothetical protein